MGAKHSSRSKRTSSYPIDDVYRFPFRNAANLFTGCADFLYNLVLVGDCETGKSCCLNRFEGKDEFSTTYKPTIGVNFGIRYISLDKAITKLHVWDTSGHERFGKITQSYLRGVHGVAIFYDTTRRETFDHVQYWIKTAKKHTEHRQPEAPMLLVGNKSDDTERNEVDCETARNFADEHNMTFFEVSAKDGTNIELALVSLVAKIRQLETH